MFLRAYICPDGWLVGVPTPSPLSPGGPADPSRKNIGRKPMRQITEKAIAFVMAIAISTGAFNVLIV